MRYAIALAQELHFQKAAQKCHISQPTLSQQIQKLEKELGAVLFERLAREIRLTSAGKIFIPKIMTALDLIDEASTSFKNSAGGLRGTVKISAIPTIGPYLLPGLIPAVRKEAPDLKLEISESTTSILVQQLKDGLIDMGILALPISDKSITEKSLGREQFYLAVSTTHALAAKKRVSLKDISKEKMLILQEGHCFSEQALAFCHKSRHDAQVVFQGSSLASVVNLAATGEGVTFVPEMAIHSLRHFPLKMVPFSEPRPSREIGVIWRASMPLDKKKQLLIKLLEQILKKREA